MPSNPLDTQVGGVHYKDLPIQPVEYILANGIGYIPGNIIKYITRYPYKHEDGLEDLEKCQHYLDILVAHLKAPQSTTPVQTNLKLNDVNPRQWDVAKSYGLLAGQD